LTSGKISSISKLKSTDNFREAKIMELGQISFLVSSIANDGVVVFPLKDKL
jgi:hypothetical protein